MAMNEFLSREKPGQGDFVLAAWLQELEGLVQGIGDVMCDGVGFPCNCLGFEAITVQ